ncbi:Dynein light chain Tctex-type 3 [Sciurus carolinensis]|nr:Dynein light chain Tctex-type 3 [Sciurus carolinensis]
MQDFLIEVQKLTFTEMKDKVLSERGPMSLCLSAMPIKELKHNCGSKPQYDSRNPEPASSSRHQHRTKAGPAWVKAPGHKRGRGLPGGQCAAAELDPRVAPPPGRVGATMEEYHRHCDEVGFNADEAHNIVKECVDGVLGGEDYNQNNINQWTASIVEQSLTHLVKLGKAYKYIVTCAVVQRSAYGFHTASSCFWDTTSDGTCTVRWENRTMNCIVNVFAIAIVL